MVSTKATATAILFIIILIGAVGSTVGEGFDSNGDFIYGEAYIENSTGTLVNIAASSTFYNITQYTTGNSNGVSISEGRFTIITTGDYQLNYHTSFTGGNNGEYEYKLTINDVGQNDCELYRTMGGTATRGSASTTCIFSATAGDIVQMTVEDLGTPAQDINIYASNLNIQLVKS